MKKELISLAKTKGFLPKGLRTENMDDFIYYLWMCELQKWIREEKGEDILVIKSKKRYYPINNSVGLNIATITPLINPPMWENYSTYEKALEKGLIEILKNLIS